MKICDENFITASPGAYAIASPSPWCLSSPQPRPSQALVPGAPAHSVSRNQSGFPSASSRRACTQQIFTFSLQSARHWVRHKLHVKKQRKTEVRCDMKHIPTQSHSRTSAPEPEVAESKTLKCPKCFQCHRLSLKHDTGFPVSPYLSFPAQFVVLPDDLTPPYSSNQPVFLLNNCGTQIVFVKQLNSCHVSLRMSSQGKCSLSVSYC